MEILWGATTPRPGPGPGQRNTRHRRDGAARHRGRCGDRASDGGAPSPRHLPAPFVPRVLEAAEPRRGSRQCCVTRTDPHLYKRAVRLHRGFRGRPSPSGSGGRRGGPVLRTSRKDNRSARRAGRRRRRGRLRRGEGKPPRPPRPTRRPPPAPQLGRANSSWPRSAPPGPGQAAEPAASRPQLSPPLMALGGGPEGCPPPRARPPWAAPAPNFAPAAAAPGRA